MNFETVDTISWMQFNIMTKNNRTTKRKFPSHMMQSKKEKVYFVMLGLIHPNNRR